MMENRTERRDGRQPQKGRRSLLVGAALLLAVGTVLTALWWLLDSPASPVLYIAVPLTLASYYTLLFLGWRDDRSGVPLRYWATVGVLVIGGVIMLVYSAWSLVWA